MREYRNKPREKRLKEIIIGQGFVSIMIIAVSLYLIFWGFGYKVNWQNMTIKHTGIIYLTYWPKDAEVFINDKSRQRSSPFDIALFSGYYETKIIKDGYWPWYQDIKVEADRVYSCKNIVLFRQKPEIQLLTNKDSISSIDAPYDTLVKNPQGDLTASSYEIWIGDTLITRLSEPISGVIWYPGMEYVAFQQGDEIRIIEKNGTNDNLLVKLTSDAPTKFLFSWDGSSLLYKDGSDYKKADIN